MSQAFVKESEEQWLYEVSPALNALLVYLTRENNNIRVYEKNITTNPKDNKLQYEMSNGLTYTKDEDNKWCIV